MAPLFLVCGCKGSETFLNCKLFLKKNTDKNINGGEDYELLFTVPLTEHERVSAIEGIKVIGHITKPELGCALITRDGQEFELKAQGWNPLKEK